MDLATVDELLTTTRSVRKRLDFTRPVEPEVIERCIEIAVQAPTGSNQQNWAFVVVTDADKKKKIADLYRKGAELYIAMPQPEYPPDDPRAAQRPRITESSVYLLEHMHEAPLYVIPCIKGRPEGLPVFATASLYGSILPAAWSFMLAARARGLGTAWTTIHLFYEKEAAAILGIPDDWTQAVLFPVAYYKGETFKPAKRIPPKQLTYWNTWGATRQ
ncbi:MAG: nitroreductase [Candidatus Dadabacteria bacterium]|nr:MAG: nitroreductase [Candidatus Dadabacteria bacterium]